MSHCSTIIFSKDRPLQLHGLLKSMDDMLSEPIETVVLYGASSFEYIKAYEEVAEDFQNVSYIRENDFKILIIL